MCPFSPTLITDIVGHMLLNITYIGHDVRVVNLHVRSEGRMECGSSKAQRRDRQLAGTGKSSGSNGRTQPIARTSLPPLNKKINSKAPIRTAFEMLRVRSLSSV